MNNIFTQYNRRIGIASCMATLIVSIAYVIVTIGWVTLSTELFLVGMEVVSMLAGLVVVTLMSSVYLYSSVENKQTSLIALLFTTCFSILTIVNHFLYLIVLRPMAAQTSVISSVFGLTHWPSITLGVDYVAWGLFLGLGLIFSSPAFKGNLTKTALRFVFLICGLLCIIGFFGLALGGQLYWFIAVGGYGIGFFVISILLTKIFLANR